jgi:predicted Zn-dependent protease
VARAARAHAPEVAAAVELEVQRGERRSRSALAYGEAIQALSAGDRPKARAALENAVVIDPENGAAWVLLSERRRLDNDMTGALVAIQNARRSDDPRVRADAESQAGMLAMAKLDFKGAVAQFRVAEGMFPGSVRTYLFEAQCHAQLSDPAAAVDALRRGLAAVPNSPELAQALAQLGASR